MIEHLFERITLRGEHRSKHRIDVFDQRLETLLLVQPRADRQCIHKQADHILNLLLFTVGRRAAHDQIILSGVAE